MRYFRYDSGTREERAAKIREKAPFLNKDSDVETLMWLLDEAKASLVYSTSLSPNASPIQWLLHGRERALGTIERECYPMADLMDHVVYARDHRGRGIIISSPYIDQSRLLARATEIESRLPWVCTTVSDSWYLAGEGEWSIMLRVAPSIRETAQGYHPRKDLYR